MQHDDRHDRADKPLSMNAPPHSTDPPESVDIDPQILAAVHDGALGFDDLSADVLESCRQAVGTSELVDLLIAGHQNSASLRLTGSFSDMPSSRPSPVIRNRPMRVGPWVGIAASVAVAAGIGLLARQAFRGSPGGAPVAVLPGNNTNITPRPDVLPIGPSRPDGDTTASLHHNTVSSDPNVARLSASVVGIRSAAGLSSGVLIRADGWVLACAHAAFPRGVSEPVEVVLSSKVNHAAQLPATVWQTDGQRDLVLLKLDNPPPGVTPLPTARLANRIDLKADCFAVGSSSDGKTEGIRGGNITARVLPDNAARLGTFLGVGKLHAALLVSDIPLAPAEIGGPLLNGDGELIGLTIASDKSVAWHVSLDEIRSFVNRLPQ